MRGGSKKKSSTGTVVDEHQHKQQRHKNNPATGSARRKKSKDKTVGRYVHPESKRPNNPPVGLVTPGTDPDQSRKRYEYDPHLDPQLQWSGKQENTEWAVDTVSLHIHERIDPITILEKVMKSDKAVQQTMFSYFGDSDNNLPLHNAIEFYRHEQNWSNRLIAGDSLLAMNSLLEKEGMEGKVQMIYFDPPYGIEYGSNFQPFVNKRSVKDGSAKDLTQEPEMIKAFRDTWELDIHSYLSYLRDRLSLSRDLLTEEGSIFVQISETNLHLVRILMDEVFGSNNFVSVITVQKTTSSTSTTLSNVSDYLCWYAKDKCGMKYKNLYVKKDVPRDDIGYKYVELKDGTRRSMTPEERHDPAKIPKDARIYMQGDLTSAGNTSDDDEFIFQGKTYTSGPNHHWKTAVSGMHVLASKNRIVQTGNRLAYVRYFDDFPYRKMNNVWTDATSGFAKLVYVVQTIPKIIERVMLMTTDPGDLVFDPTCGSGTTAYVSEKWGRRWITCDTSRIAIALTKQRLMTSKFEYYTLLNDGGNRGLVSSGFEYEKVPHITLGSLANNKPPLVETLFDRPLSQKEKVRISGPFTVEAVPSATVKSMDVLSEEYAANLEVSPRAYSYQEEWRHELLKTGIRGRGRQKINFTRADPHPATKWLHVDAETRETTPKRTMVSFGPEYSPLEPRQVEFAIQEARTLIPPPQMIIFAAMQFDPEASKTIDELKWPNVTILKAEINKDLLSRNLKKGVSSSESFWLMGQPDIDLDITEDGLYVITVRGFDYYDTNTEEVESGDADKIAMWMLDADYDGRSVYPQQVFFPIVGEDGGWIKLAKTLKDPIDPELVSKYGGTESIPFEAGPNKRVAVKIIDYRGIESLRIIGLE